jgi:hypothetical protein
VGPSCQSTDTNPDKPGTEESRNPKFRTLEDRQKITEKKCLGRKWEKAEAKDNNRG